MWAHYVRTGEPVFWLARPDSRPEHQRVRGQNVDPVDVMRRRGDLQAADPDVGPKRNPFLAEAAAATDFLCMTSEIGEKPEGIPET